MPYEMPSETALQPAGRLSFSQNTGISGRRYSARNVVGGEAFIFLHTFGATYDVPLRLIGKRVVDFLLVTIELFTLGVTEYG